MLISRREALGGMAAGLSLAKPHLPSQRRCRPSPSRAAGPITTT